MIDLDELIARVKSVKVADLNKLHAMFGMSNATLTVVGDFDGAALKGWLEGAL